MLCIVRWKSSTQTICCSNCYFPKSGGGLDLVRTKRSRPSVKRGWDTGSSHHCKRKTRRPWAALASAGGLPSNNMAQLHASVLLSLPKQWHGPHNQPRISSALFWCHCCDKTTHRWCFFFFFKPAFSAVSRRTEHRSFHRNSKGDAVCDQYELSHRIWPCFDNFIPITDW